MKNNDYKDKLTEDDDEGEGSSGAQGEVYFRYKDAMSIDPRDDVLSPDELSRLLAQHQDLHKALVDKQKADRKERKTLKEKPESLVDRRPYKPDLGRGGGGGSNQYKVHPIALKFAGRDNKVSPDPKANTAETNNEKKNELLLNYDLKNAYKKDRKQQYTFNPKPRPY